MTTAASTLSPRAVAIGIGCLCSTTLIWGVNWPIMKIGLAEIPPWTFRALMAPGGGLFLFLLVRLSGDSLAVPRDKWVPLAVSSLFNVTVWQMCAGIGVSLMPSGRASILAFTMPVWASLLGYFFLGERLTPRRIAALAFGMAGIGVLIVDDASLEGTALLGAAFMLAASMSWAVGTIVVKRVGVWGMSTLSLTGWQLILGCAPMIAGAVILEDADFSHISPAAWMSVAYNIFFATSLGMVGFLKALSIFPASITGIGTLMAPVVGTISAALMLGEPLGWRETTSLVLVCIALALVLTRIGARRD